MKLRTYRDEITSLERQISALKDAIHDLLRDEAALDDDDPRLIATRTKARLALGVSRSHLQDVVQVDYAQRLYDELRVAQAVIVSIRDIGPGSGSNPNALKDALDHARTYCASRGIGATESPSESDG
jgi:hypothetical protein